jgi:hypothetical protein
MRVLCTGERHSLSGRGAEEIARKLDVIENTT